MRLDLNTIMLRPDPSVHMFMTSKAQHNWFGRTRYTHKVITFCRNMGVTTCVTIKYTAR